MDDEWFRERIARLCQAERGSPQWHNALSHLIPAIASLPGLKRNNNPQSAEDYEEIFNNVRLKLSDNICDNFPPQHELIANSLVGWINKTSASRDCWNKCDLSNTIKLFRVLEVF